MTVKFQTFFLSMMWLLTATFCFSADPILSGAAGAVQSTDYYWVTFSGDCSCDSVFIMQIDGDGNVLKAPKAVLDVERYGAGASGLVKLGSSKLVLLHWKDSSFLARAIINKSTLNASSIKTTSLYSVENEFLHVTQNASKNYLIAEDPRKGGKLSTFEISSKGIPKTTSTETAPQAPMESDEASISSDGEVVITNRYSPSGGKEKLYVQFVKDGQPVGSPKFLTSFTDIESVDVTNELTDGNRFVVYTVDAGTSPDDRIFLQKMNSTGKKIGQKKIVNTPPDRHEDSQTVSIDPLGGFVLFTMGGDDYGCAGNDILVYQKLSSDGSPSGPVKVLGSCELVTDDIMNIDILKE